MDVTHAHAKAYAAAREKLSIERGNLRETTAIREEKLNSQDKDIDKWTKAQDLANDAQEKADELREIVESHVMGPRSSKSTTLLHARLAEKEQARHESMTCEERLAECKNEPEIVGAAHGIKTASTEQERYYYELTTGKRVRTSPKKASQ